MTFAEFFAGIGLMRIGLERAGWRTEFANDTDEDKWRMYRNHFGDTGEFVVGDVHHEIIRSCETDPTLRIQIETIG